MADETKTKTSEELDQELDEMVDGMLEKNKNYKYDGGLTEENWEEELEKIPIFMTKSPKEGEPLSSDMEALQALKYEDENPIANATAYKEEGNYEYKKKNFKNAVLAYTEGIKVKCEDSNLNAVLYTNRATVHFTIANYRSALKDSIQARKFEQNYMKAIIRGANASFHLKLYDHAKRWCDEGLQIESENEILQRLRKEAVAAQKKVDRDGRKAKLAKKKKHAEFDALIEAIKSRHIRFEKTTNTDEDDVSDDDDEEGGLRKKLAEYNLEPNHHTGARVQLDEHNKLYWPVMFYYPEYKQTDFIGAFCEEHSFIDHFKVIFGTDLAPWDEENKYEPEMLEVYYEDHEAGNLIAVKSSTDLKKVISDQRFLLRQGTPSFIILVKGSSFKKEFIKHCTVEKL